jgi:hypothetical protein
VGRGLQKKELKRKRERKEIGLVTVAFPTKVNIDPHQYIHDMLGLC